MTETGLPGQAKRGVRVGLVDDHPLIRDGVVAALVTAGFRVTVAASTEDLDGFPGVVLCDLGLPEGRRQGSAAVDYLTSHGCRVIAFSILADLDSQVMALAAGAVGYLVKTAPGTVLCEAVQTVAAGGHWIRPELAGRLLLDAEAPAGGRTRLDRRARAWLRALSQGDSEEEFETATHLAPGTTRALTEQILAAVRADRRKLDPSPRELEVIDAIGVQGLTYKDAAAFLNMGKETLADHLDSIKKKWLLAHPEQSGQIQRRSVAILWARLLEQS